MISFFKKNETNVIKFHDITGIHVTADAVIDAVITASFNS